MHYFPGERVTVDFYRDLPVRDYALVVLRVHSGRILDQGSKTDDVILFTGEPYHVARYDPDQQARRVGWARYHKDASPPVGILPKFIEESMLGKFDDTRIVMMAAMASAPSGWPRLSSIRAPTPSSAGVARFRPPTPTPPGSVSWRIFSLMASRPPALSPGPRPKWDRILSTALSYDSWKGATISSSNPLFRARGGAERSRL